MPDTDADRQKAREKEWNTWRAKHPIDIDGIRAFNTGDPVPAGHVTRGVVAQSDVEKAS